VIENKELPRTRRCCQTGPAGATLWSTLFQRRVLLVDLMLLLILGFFHVVAWATLDVHRYEAYDRIETVGRVQATSTAGLTVVGILVPLTVIAIQLQSAAKRGSTDRYTMRALVDLFVASTWLLASLMASLYVLYFSAFKGYTENILAYRHIGILLGFQLFFLFVGVFRLVWGLSAIVSSFVGRENNVHR
jgi:hypothetical protein